MTIWSPRSVPRGALFLTALVAGALAIARADAQVYKMKAVVSADSLFREGRALIGARQYQEAEDVLQSVADQYPQSENAPTALYWRAWAQDAAGAGARDTARLTSALATLTTLAMRYPDAAIARDARWLHANVLDDLADLGQFGALKPILATTQRVLQNGIACDDPDLDLELVIVQRPINFFKHSRCDTIVADHNYRF